MLQELFVVSDNSLKLRAKSAKRHKNQNHIAQIKKNGHKKQSKF